ncbi:Phage terminase-like protein, large subunit, contains N-terminal HTH domain [Halomonas shengliensis]|uniref:Phage terminase-like protein, large subunit, contains N-terminal HTH domain n=1 Tax=Halomonas shengliensis TaxID=419597 RepID=A0A1H0IDS2_9GAMM|nr:terminase TerL endonuclease subunit [Halomonas shengliensis]SDO29506.1 Phage terminase-like protein, large subunit, contains N-terminal HTH domain [Halomonas shengliensis]
MASYPNVNSANKYARDVVGGRIVACKWVKLACKRHLDDLKAAKARSFPYRFDRDTAERVCDFIQLLPHTKGKWARERRLIILEPWQRFLFAALFGWLHKKTGQRRYREAYIEVPRKNGKSVIAAGVANYMLAADGEYGAEVYCGATTEKQAWEVFRPAKLMLTKSPALISAAGIEVMAKNISIPEDGSRLEPLIGNPGDGSSPSCALVDEFHEHQTPDLYDTMLTGMGARDQPLMFIITTAGFNLAGPCYDKRRQAQQMLDGSVPNPELFAAIYTIDEGDDWQDSSTLRKANPNFGVSVSEEFLLKAQRDAVRYPSRQNSFLTKHLNLWVSARTAWLNMADWHSAGDEALALEHFEGKPCWIGVDLASKTDIAAIALLFRDEIEAGKTRWTAFVRSYLPEGAIERASNNRAAYESWINSGDLITTDGEELDFDIIRDDLMDLSGRFEIEEIAYDPWRATQLAHQLMKDGAEIVEYRNTVQNMSPPMREMEAAITAGRWRHACDPVLTWMASNVVAKVDAKENIYPRKERSENKIDGIIAILMALGRAVLADGPQDDDLSDHLENHGIRTL